ncbi:MAG: iron ABC transporter substrate-binding protein [Syntrophomonas sp.]
MNKKSIALLLVICSLFVILLGGCGTKKQSTKTEAQQITVADSLGRQVTVTVPLKGVVAVGPGSLRLYCYVNGMDKIVGVENFEKSNPTGRPYLYAYPDLINLPVIGTGGPNSTPNAEQIVAVNPDIILVDSNVDKAGADSLQSKTGVPVMVLSYGQQLGTFDQTAYDSINMIGKVTGQEKRAAEIVAYLEELKKDLNDRVKDIPEAEKPTVYVGGLGMKGSHGMLSTQAQYPPFTAVLAKNVADETGKSGSLSIDPEKLIEWNPDKIFLDENGFVLVKQDYEKNPAYYNSLAAVKNGELYAQMPFNYYTTNIDTALADAYYIGTVLYPEQFKDIDPAEKADEIYTFLVGKPVYSQMATDYGGFIKLSFDK